MMAIIVINNNDDDVGLGVVMQKKTSKHEGCLTGIVQHFHVYVSYAYIHV